MKRLKQTIGVLFSFIMLFAFSIDCFAMDFDAEAAYESIFVIYSGNYEGSGFAIGSNTVVTNAHVIGNQNDIIVKAYSGQEYNASIYLFNEALDIAILSVDNAEFIPLEIGNCDDIKVGDDIYAIGAPRSLEYTLTKGVISNKSRTIGFNKYIQIDAAINSGNSGGPLLNSAGQVIGVNSMKISDAEGIGLAIPISTVTSFMEGNDMNLTEDKTVDGKIEYVPADLPEEEGNVLVQKVPDYTLAIIFGVLLGMSVVINIIFLIILVYRKNKDIVVPTDARDRTDFEIDILE
ncbi:MAG: trypsin-like peptidase domain-containing protein [Lachnospiraceae bacterium]|nr:trypsin-like peptidase domain-containing protein [Lachnospiraceae bacterium]